MFKYSIILIAVTTVINSYAAEVDKTSNLDEQTQNIQKLETVVVTANPLGLSTASNSSSSVMNKQKLREQSGTGLGQILQNTVGVSTTGFGAVANRPSIRGLEGDRIKIMQNGNGLFDASNVSYDHATPINPVAIDKIEIIKGTNALLYGGNALGGVVNVIDNRISKQNVDSDGIIHTSLNTSIGGANNERSTAIKLKAGLSENFVINADAFYTKTSDIKIKGFVRSEELRNQQILPITDEKKDKLVNTDSQTSGGAVGLSYINNNGFTGASIDSYTQNYGSPVEDTVRIKLKQTKLAFETEQKIQTNSIESINFKSNFSDYEHKEIESGEVGTIFKNKAQEASLQVKHNPINLGSSGKYELSGILGTQYQHSKFSALGEEAFIPTTNSQNFAFYAIEKMPLKFMNYENSYLQFGARIQNNSIKASAEDNPHFTDANKSFNTYSTNASIFHEITPNLSTTLTLNYAQRAPTFYELFANGVHVATNAYELGDISLNKEKSKGIDLGFKYKKQGYEVKANIYANKFKNYISLQNTGIKVDNEGNANSNGLDEYKYSAVPAQFYGFEIEGKVPLSSNSSSASMNNKLSLLWQSDYTRAYNTDNNQALPRISPLRLGLGLAYEYDKWLAKIKATYNAKQNKIPSNDIPSPSYTDLSLHIQKAFSTKYGYVTLFMRGDNLLNQDIRPASDFLRNVAPYGKRSIKLGMNIDF